MKRFLLISAALLSLFPSGILEARAVMSELVFKQQLREIERLNWLDIEDARASLGPLRSYVGGKPTPENRILLAVAEAPLNALDNGFREARNHLISFFREAEAPENSPEVSPLLRCAIAGLALRQGESREAFRQVLLSLPSCRADTPKYVLNRIFRIVTALSLEVGHPEFASFVLENWEQFGAPDPIEKSLFQTVISWYRWDYAASERNLDSASLHFNSSTSPQQVLEFWLERIWLGLAEGTLIQAEEYLAKVQNLLKDTPDIPAQAEVYFPEGLLFLELQSRDAEAGRKLNRDMDELQSQWMKAMATLPASNGARVGGFVLYYALVILLVLLVILLVLVLRFRSQRHLNEQLEDSIQKARIAEEAAEESNALKTRFLANVSHELKTPMSGLVGMASLLDEMVTDPVQRKYLSTIRTCSENLLVLVNDLLDLGRIESGNIEIEKAPFDVRQSVEYCLELVRDRAAAKGLELRNTVDEEVPRQLVGDSTRICQIMTNLLANGVKYTDKGFVDLQIAFTGTLGDSGNLVVSVRDTGIGVAPERIHTIFEPFSKERNVEQQRKEGSGLGLAICRKLIALMGGAITVQSKPGKGSTFEFSVPLKAVAEEP